MNDARKAYVDPLSSIEADLSNKHLTISRGEVRWLIDEVKRLRQQCELSRRMREDLLARAMTTEAKLTGTVE